MSERIWCVPADRVHAARPAAGFWSWPAARSEAFAAQLASEGAFWPREAVETDETRRQVIPYLLLRADGRYFTYRRLAGGGEARLMHLRSIGVGGHINDEHEVDDKLADGLARELREELDVPDGAVRRLILHGFLALDDTPVDRVHLGVVSIADIDPNRAEEVNVREQDKLACVGWFTAAELRAQLEVQPFEGWSRALIAAGLP